MTPYQKKSTNLPDDYLVESLTVTQDNNCGCVISTKSESKTKDCCPSTGGGGSIDLSDYVRKTGPNQTITSPITFTSPVVVPNATADNQAINLGQANAAYSPISGSANYIQNQNTAYQVANFKITGTGTIDVTGWPDTDIGLTVINHTAGFDGVKIVVGVDQINMYADYGGSQLFQINNFGGLPIINANSLEIRDYAGVDFSGHYTSLVFQNPTTNAVVTIKNQSGSLALVSDIPTTLPPSGPAGGDLTGTYPNPTVSTINSITKAYYDPTSSIQTQLNSKLAISVASSTYMPLAGGTFTGDVQQATAPINSTSLINKGYVDSIIIGVIWVGADADSTSNIALSGEQTINGVTTSSSRVFVHGQTNQTQNGIYISSSGAWARDSDASTGAQIIKLAILIEGGTNKGQQWVNTNASIIVGTTNITFGQNFGLIYSAGTGLLLTGGTIFTIDSTYTATSSRTGYLSSSDWSTFNAKEPAINSGTSTQYWRGDKTMQNLNSAVITSTLTGYASGAGTISSSDSILTAIQKLNGNIAEIPTDYITSDTTQTGLTGAKTTSGIWTFSSGIVAGSGQIGTKFVSIKTSATGAGLVAYQNTSNAGYTSFDLYDDITALQMSFGHANSGTGGTLLPGNNYINSNSSVPLLFLANTAEVFRYTPTAISVVSGVALNIGATSNPTSEPLYLTANITSGIARLQNTNNAGYVGVDYYDNSSVKQLAMGYRNPGTTSGTISYFDAVAGNPIVWLSSSVEKMRLTITGLGLLSSVPTHTLTLGSASTGITYYNTPDQTTNYERVKQYWNSNAYIFSSEAGGAGSFRDIAFSFNGGIIYNISNAGTNGAFMSVIRNTSGATPGFGIASTYSASTAVIQNGLAIYPTINQTTSVAAGYRGLWISPFEQAVGTGAKYLIDAGTNSASNLTGTHTSKFTVDNSGNAIFSGTVSITGLTNHSVLFTGVSGLLSQDNNNFYYDSSTHRLSVSVAGDFTGSDSVNIYGQYDTYQPQSTIGTVTSSGTTPGISASTSRGTGASPVINNTGDLIGSHSFWAYTGSSPAYTYMAGIVGTAIGATSANLGGQLDFYVKADGGAASSAVTILNDNTLRTNGYLLIGQSNTSSATPRQLIMGEFATTGNSRPAWLFQSPTNYIGIGQADETAGTTHMRIGAITGTKANWGAFGGLTFSLFIDGVVGIGTQSVVASSMLTLASTTRGSIPMPSMTTTQRTAISSPAEAVWVYDATLHNPFVYNGSTWASLVLSTGGSMTGQLNINNSAIALLGATPASDPSIYITSAGIKVGTTGNLTHNYTGYNNGTITTDTGASVFILNIPTGVNGTLALTSQLPIHGNSTTTGAATTVVTVTIGTTQANNTYFVSITPKDLLTAVNWYISAQTTTTFDITFATALTGSINFDWGIIP